MERTEVLGITYNTLRRSLPSIGEATDFAKPEMGDGKILRATHPTSRTQAAGRFHSVAVDRHKAVILAHMAATALKIPLADIRCISIPLQCIRQLRGQVEVAEVLAVSGVPWALPNLLSEREPQMDLPRIATLATTVDAVAASDS